MPKNVVLKHLVMVTALTAPLAGCLDGAQQAANSAVKPAMMWDAKPEAPFWTAHTMAELSKYDTALAAQVPSDIAVWCPDYANATTTERRAFWAGLMSGLSRIESGWNPAAVGGRGRYYGLLQIMPQSARYYGCEANTKAELKDGPGNLACAARIMADGVGRDGVVAGSGKEGVARSWGPMQKADKRQELSEWTRSLPYCKV